MTALLDQCCDGETYLRLGEACATQGICYDEQRPMGAVYWFSLPYRLGLDANALIVGHLLLVSVSIVLSILVTGQPLIRHQKSPCRYLLWAGVIILSGLIHLVFLYPLLRVSLSDLPAGMLALSGIWLLLLSSDDEKYRWMKLAGAGLCLGLAVWIRAFYLYPLLAGISVWIIVSCYRGSFKTCDYWLLLALLPIAIQYGATYNHTGSFSFIAPDRVNEGMNLHLNDPAVGYDIIIRPSEYWRWQSDCGEIQGLLTSIKSTDMRSLRCLIKGRFNFYFGSYSKTVYPSFHSFENYWGNSPPPKLQPPFELRTLESSIENTTSDRIRNWSAIYLIANILIICIVITYKITHLKYAHDTNTLIDIFIFFIIIESLLIIPEQRFIIVPLIMIWIICLRIFINLTTRFLGNEYI